MKDEKDRRGQWSLAALSGPNIAAELAKYLPATAVAASDNAELAQRVQGGETITLLCSSACTRESRCHRSLLRELIEARLATHADS